MTTLQFQKKFLTFTTKPEKQTLTVHNRKQGLSTKSYLRLF
jgi:hypothetical protein